MKTILPARTRLAAFAALVVSLFVFANSASFGAPAAPKYIVDEAHPVSVRARDYYGVYSALDAKDLDMALKRQARPMMLTKSADAIAAVRAKLGATEKKGYTFYVATDTQIPADMRIEFGSMVYRSRDNIAYQLVLVGNKRSTEDVQAWLAGDKSKWRIVTDEAELAKVMPKMPVQSVQEKRTPSLTEKIHRIIVARIDGPAADTVAAVNQ